MAMVAVRVLAVDTCSLIALDEARILDEAATLWRLEAPPSILREAGICARRCMPFGVPPSKSLDAAADRVRRTDPFLTSVAAKTDRELLVGAEERGYPLLSEDGKLLNAAELSGLDCFDSLAAVEVLFAAGLLDERQAGDAAQTMRSRLALSPRRFAWAEQLHAVAQKLRPLR